MLRGHQLLGDLKQSEGKDPQNAFVKIKLVTHTVFHVQ